MRGRAQVGSCYTGSQIPVSSVEPRQHGFSSERRGLEKVEVPLLTWSVGVWVGGDSEQCQSIKKKNRHEQAGGPLHRSLRYPATSYSPPSFITFIFTPSLEGSPLCQLFGPFSDIQ